MIKINKKRLKLIHNLLTAGYNGAMEAPLWTVFDVHQVSNRKRLHEEPFSIIVNLSELISNQDSVSGLDSQPVLNSESGKSGSSHH
jgi:hypothetical protein